MTLSISHNQGLCDVPPPANIATRQRQMTTTTYPLFKEFVAFIKAREQTRVNRENGVWPWTTDPIISKYRFCNVNRQHDRQTIELQKWLFGCWDISQVVFFNAVVARLFNQAHTCRAIGWQDPTLNGWKNDVRDGVAVIRASARTPFNPAYIVSTNGRSMDKVEYLLEVVLGGVAERWATRPESLISCEAWANWYKQTDGLGDFMVNQIVTDLKYGPLADAADWSTFVLAGPGTKRGLNRVRGDGKDCPMKQTDALRHLTNIRQLLKGVLLGHVKLSYFKDLNNLSNCFCEFDKYMRAASGEGTPKQKYEAIEEPL